MYCNDPRRSGWLPSYRWDGDFINFTRDCLECPQYRHYKGENSSWHLCVWGVHWKQLEPVESPEGCRKPNDRQPRFPCAKRVDEYAAKTGLVRMLPPEPPTKQLEWMLVG